MEVWAAIGVPALGLLTLGIFYLRLRLETEILEARAQKLKKEAEIRALEAAAAQEVAETIIKGIENIPDPARKEQTKNDIKAYSNNCGKFEAVDATILKMGLARRRSQALIAVLKEES